MATNTTNENCENELMDGEKSSINEEGGQKEPVVRPNFAGPMTWLVCFRYIIFSSVKPVANERIDVPLNDILEILATNNTDCDDYTDELERFVKEYYINLYICIINQNEKSFYFLNNTSEQESQQWPRAYLVFDKYNRSFYPFYIRDESHKILTTFPTNDTYVLTLFERSVDAYKWSIQPETIQQTHKQNAPILNQQNLLTTNATPNTVDVHNQPKNKIKASDVCNLFIQNVQNVIPRVGPQLDILNLSFISSEYRLRKENLMSPKTICTTLISQLQLLLQLSDLTAKQLETNRTTNTNNMHTSMETDDSTMVQNASSDNHKQEILTNCPIVIKPSVRSSSRSITFTNPQELPTTTTHNCDETIKLPKLKLLNQPSRLRHNREPKTIGKGCPAVQVEGAPQRTSLLVALPEVIKNYQQEFYIGSHVKTYDGNYHEQKRLMPIPKRTKKDHNLESNEQDVPDEFDLESEGVFSKIKSYELERLQKGITFVMFNLKQDEVITKDLIKENKLIWCRLMFAIYIKSSDGKFKRVSPVIYSDLIEDTKSSQSLPIETILPDEFCERGGQMVFIQLNESVEKCNLRVYCNDEVLDENDYQIAKTILSFESPVCLLDRTNLEIIIYKKNTNEPMTFMRPYYQHDNHPDPCGVINEN